MLSIKGADLEDEFLFQILAAFRFGGLVVYLSRQCIIYCITYRLCNTTFAEAITCTLCNKLYIGETGRHLGDLFHEHLRDVEKNDKDASNPVVRHFNLPNHSKQHMAICGLSLQQGTAESRNNLEHKLIFQIRTLNPHGINKGFSLN